MVAITVILAAVIATFVLGLGDQVSNTAPQASFSTEYDSGGAAGSAGEVTVTHDGGDSIKASNLYFRGTGFDNSGSGDITDSNDKWPGGQASGSNSKVVAGDRVVVAVSSNSYEFDVVYQSATGDNSATLATASGPDA